MDSDQVMDENMFNKPTIVLSSGNLKSASSSVGLVSVVESMPFFLKYNIAQYYALAFC